MIAKDKFAAFSSRRSKVSRGVYLALFASSISCSLYAQEAENSQPEEDNEIEEVVVIGSRLQGSAQAVLQERKDQAFVADIMGAEQISRTGDSDAAAALRRVTGLTLVDGKFIYIRGLGERYSSTQLNGMNIPSPDPTRSVMPLDLFPADIIESLSVQKSFSPDMPAHFGGGNVNIRTKSIPSEEIFKLTTELGLNTNNDKNSPWYNGGGDDGIGHDDGTRSLPQGVRDLLYSGGIEGITQLQNVDLISSLNTDISSAPQSIDPDFGIGLTYGNKYDLADDSKFGFLFTTSYKNSWLVSNERTVNNLNRSGGVVGINEFADGSSTEHKVRVSAMLNIGYEYNQNHKIEFSNIYLQDTRDRLRDRLFESTNTINEDLEERRKLDILYEERELLTHQIKGTHTLVDLNNAGFDWYYSDSRADRSAPGGFEANFRIDFIDDGSGNLIRNEQIARDVNTIYDFQQLHDDSETSGFNFSYPIDGKDYSIELKVGADFFQKDRDSENITIELQSFTVPNQFLIGNDFSEIFSSGNINDPTFDVKFVDTTSNGDKFRAATANNAYYFMADVNIGMEWRFTGGVRYEDFRQVSIPFQSFTDFFDVGTDKIVDLIFTENDLFPAAAVTYIQNSEMQWRFNYSQTAIRPDLRDISTTFYVDPLTEFLVRGSTSLQSSTIDNFDVRWEWYLETGENISVALFYKDISKPIEMIELPSATEGAPQLLTANAKSGELYGVEFEFLKDLSFIGDEYANFFLSGNFTASDSEVDIGLDGDPTTRSLFEQQLGDALNTTQGVTEVITNNKRRLVGHSKWVSNLQLGWDSDNGEHSASLIYNAFGPRIIIPGVNGFKDGQEKTFHSLDLVYTFFLDYDSSIKLRVKNLLDSDKEIVQDGVTILKENVGTSINLSYSREF